MIKKDITTQLVYVYHNMMSCDGEVEIFTTEEAALEYSRKCWSRDFAKKGACWRRYPKNDDGVYAEIYKKKIRIK